MRLAHGCVVLVAFGFWLAGCSDLHRSNGDSCVKSDDCLSNYCSGQMCINAPFEYTDAEVHSPEVDADFVAFGAPVPEAGPVDAGLFTITGED